LIFSFSWGLLLNLIVDELSGLEKTWTTLFHMKFHKKYLLFETFSLKYISFKELGVMGSGILVKKEAQGGNVGELTGCFRDYS